MKHFHLELPDARQRAAAFAFHRGDEQGQLPDHLLLPFSNFYQVTVAARCSRERKVESLANLYETYVRYRLQSCSKPTVAMLALRHFAGEIGRNIMHALPVEDLSACHDSVRGIHSSRP